MDIVAVLDPDDLEQEALAAAADARSLAALDEVRVHYLGRKSAQALIDIVGHGAPVLMFTHDPQPSVRARAVAARKALADAGIVVVESKHVAVPGPVAVPVVTRATPTTATLRRKIDPHQKC